MKFTRLPYASGIENPVGIMSKLYRKPDQIIQPYQFGDNASKATCFWLNGIPLLRRKKKDFYPPRIVNGLPRWGNQTDSGQNKETPGADRWQIRSKTYPGIADAIVQQWPGYVPQTLFDTNTLFKVA